MWPENEIRHLILVVDDEPAILKMLSLVLSNHGIEVHVAHSGEAAVEIYRRLNKTVALVLLDVQMSGLWDGPHTLAELRRINSKVRVVFMSASTGKYTRDELLDLGAIAVFSKPFSSLPRLALLLKKLITSPTEA